MESSRRRRLVGGSRPLTSRLTVDASEVTFLDSAGRRALLAVGRDAAEDTGSGWVGAESQKSRTGCWTGARWSTPWRDQLRRPAPRTPAGETKRLETTATRDALIRYR
jgi:hypothetical protein